MKFFIAVLLLFSLNAFAQKSKNNSCFSINPLINSFFDNLIEKDVNLKKNYLTIISLKDKDGNYNIDFELTGDIAASTLVSKNESKTNYGNVKILLIGKTDEDFKFLKKSIRRTKKVFTNNDISKNNTNFYDEDYVWSTFFNDKKELINIYIPEERETADKIFSKLKNDIKISPAFKSLDCNCF